MNLFDILVNTYSELTDADFHPLTGSILLSDDGDGIVYISKWEFNKPIPTGLKLGK